MTRFAILGLPRSGTTYLQTLLNAHPDIQCRGEMFDPWLIDDDGAKTRDRAALVARDRDPGGFLDRALAGEGLKRVPRVTGLKILFQHHPDLFRRVLPERPDLRLIHLRRANRLAQFASLQQVRQTGAWVARGDAPPARVTAGPLWAMSECNRMATEDHLLGVWLSTLPHAALTLDYAELFRDDIPARLCAFLDVPARPLGSALRRQGTNRVVDRFAEAGAIAAHFTAMGHGDWLGPEL